MTISQYLYVQKINFLQWKQIEDPSRWELFLSLRFCRYLAEDETKNTHRRRLTRLGMGARAEAMLPDIFEAFTTSWSCGKPRIILAAFRSIPQIHRKPYQKKWQEDAKDPFPALFESLQCRPIVPNAKICYAKCKGREIQSYMQHVSMFHKARPRSVSKQAPSPSTTLHTAWLLRSTNIETLPMRKHRPRGHNSTVHLELCR